MVPPTTRLLSGPRACHLCSSCPSWPLDILALFLHSQGNLCWGNRPSGQCFRRSPQGGVVEVQFCWRPEKSFLVPCLSSFALSSLLWKEIYIFLSIYRASQVVEWLKKQKKKKKSICLCRKHKRLRFNPWVGKIPWSRKWQPAPVFLPGKFHGQRSLASSTGSRRVGHSRVHSIYKWAW